MRREFAGTGPLRGRRALLAATLTCQTSFVSQVLTDRAHLSLEHAIRTSRFLKQNELERQWFMLLVQKDRAGSKELEAHFEEQLEKLRAQRRSIHERIEIRTELSAEDQMRYYSTWYYSALHVMAALPGLNTPEAMSARLKLDPRTVREALEFLEKRGFIKRLERGDGYAIGSRRIHLKKGSSMLPRHHANWRMRAIDAVDADHEDALHYSAILGIARKDVPRLRERMLSLLQEFEPIIRDSPEEAPVAMLMDLFEL